MSELFSAGMEAKLSEALQEAGIDAVVTEFVGMVCYMDSDGEKYWSLTTSDRQTVVITMGLLDVAQMLVQDQAAQMFLGD